MNDPYWWTRDALRQVISLKGNDLDGITQMMIAAFKQYDDIEALQKAQPVTPIQERHERYRIAIEKGEEQGRLRYQLKYWWTRDAVKQLVASKQRNNLPVDGNIWMMAAAYKQFDDIEALFTTGINDGIIARHERFRLAIEKGEERAAQYARGEGETAG